MHGLGRCLFGLRANVEKIISDFEPTKDTSYLTHTVE